MASLKDVQQLTQGLEDLVGQLNSELGNGEVDFSKLQGITDQISEQADGLAETFSNINETLQERIARLTVLRKLFGVGRWNRIGESSGSERHAGEKRNHDDRRAPGMR